MGVTSRLGRGHWPWSLAGLKQRLSALELKHYDVVGA